MVSGPGSTDGAAPHEEAAAVVRAARLRAAGDLAGARRTLVRLVETDDDEADRYGVADMTPGGEGAQPGEQAVLLALGEVEACLGLTADAQARHWRTARGATSTREGTQRLTALGYSHLAAAEAVTAWLLGSAAPPRPRTTGRRPGARGSRPRAGSTGCWRWSRGGRSTSCARERPRPRAPFAPPPARPSLALVAAKGYNALVGRRFTLLDDPFYRALQRVCQALADEGLPFCLVGGGAAQAWIASLRTGAGQRRLDEEPVLAGALRQTTDLDFATRADDARMVAVLNGLAAAHGSGAHVLGPRALRLGPVSIALTLSPADLSGMHEQYDRFLESRTDVRLRRGSLVDVFPTIGLEALLATKLTRRGNMAKDILDVGELLAAAREAGRSVDLAQVRPLVAGRPGALDLLDQIATRLEDEP
ncbi:MAG TPA: hypothetical protein VGQ83_18765 [Polyangia bacterium]